MGMAGWLVDKQDQRLGTMYMRGATLNFVINPRAEAYLGPLAILVDGTSASTSEIFAGGLKDIGRAEYVGITDAEALQAFHYLCRTEGIIPALESSHAVAYAMKLAATMKSDQSILVNLSGRGDKDIGTVADLSNADFYCRPSCRGQSVKGGTEQPILIQP